MIAKDEPMNYIDDTFIWLLVCVWCEHHILTKYYKL